MEIHLHQLKFEGDDPWTRQFNFCSDLFQRANDQSLTEEEQSEAFKAWFEQRQRLELGIY